MSVWTTRRARALALAAGAPHAEEILRCYAAVTEVQERVAAQVPVERWLARVIAAEPEGPRLQLEGLPLAEMLPLMDALLDAMAGVGTPVMIEQAARMRDASVAERRELLGGALTPDTSGADGPGFHIRTFVEAVVTPLASRVLPIADPPEGSTSGVCRACGAPPVVATLRDLPNALGSRGLLCGRCGTEQRIRRLTCVRCGETAADRLHIHSAESVPHVRVDECRSCASYLKTVDLRKRGDAVPQVDDLATLELDLWARERGLKRVQANIFGL